MADAYLMVHYGRQDLDPGPDQAGGEDGAHDHQNDDVTDDDAGPQVPALIY